MTPHPAAELLDVIEVPLGARAYNVHVGAGILSTAGDLIRSEVAPRRVAIVTDENVAEHYLAPLENSLDRAGIVHCRRILPPGEGTKSFAMFGELCNWLLDEGIERGDAVVALGGGVIGDLAGFAASTVRRGINFVQIPTTLLAQVDSSVGGKTGIDTRQGKNLIGSFYQPRLVIADVATLDTLPERELRAGYAEVAKYGLIDMPDFFAWLETNGHGILAGDPAVRIAAISRCIGAKARIVAADEREAGCRALLNLGHTFGHALEAAAGYGDALRHGEAVSIGMVLAYRLSALRGNCSADDARRVSDHLQAIGLPTRIADLDPPPASDELISFMKQDKKVSGGRLVFILTKGIGKAIVCHDVTEEDVAKVLDGSGAG